MWRAARLQLDETLGKKCPFRGRHQTIPSSKEIRDRSLSGGHFASCSNGFDSWHSCFHCWPNHGGGLHPPEIHKSRITVYDEGYTSCSNQEIGDNPIGLCKNLPKICDNKYSLNAGPSLLPTILTTWSLGYTIYKGVKNMKNAPKPETLNLPLRAKVKLRLRGQALSHNSFKEVQHHLYGRRLLSRQHVSELFGKSHVWRVPS